MGEVVFYLDNVNTTEGNSYDFKVNTGIMTNVSHMSLDRCSLEQSLPSFNDSCNIISIRIWQMSPLLDLGIFHITIPLDTYWTTPILLASAVNALFAAARPPLNRIAFEFDKIAHVFRLRAITPAQVQFHLLDESDGVSVDTYTRLGFTKDQWGPNPHKGPTAYTELLPAKMPADTRLTQNIYIVNEVTLPSTVSSTEPGVETRNLLVVLPLPERGVQQEFFLYDRRPIPVRSFDFDHFIIRLLDDRMTPLDSNAIYAYLEVRLFVG